MTTEQTIYRGEASDDRESWRAIRATFDVVRPHDDPAYLDLMAPAGAANRMFYFECGGARVIYTFHLQPLDPAVLGPGVEGLSVVTSPYGYGGPMVELTGAPLSQADDVAREWQIAWSGWARENRVVSEFVREDLHHERLLPSLGGSRVFGQSNVVVPLDVDPEIRWRSYAAKVRKNVRRARECGLRVEFSTSADAVAAFHEVYLGTVCRRQASDDFAIGLARMVEFIKEVEGEGGAVVALTVREDAVESAELVLVGSHEIYSFLGGTRQDAFPMRPNDLLKHEVCEWGAERGKHEYVLGGGFASGDGIYQYKASFAPRSLRDYYTRRVVHDSETYDRLVDARQAMAALSGAAWEPRGGHFPAFLS